MRSPVGGPRGGNGEGGRWGILLDRKKRERYELLYNIYIAYMLYDISD